MVDKQKLNWITLLYDENIFIDSEAFRNWDQNLEFEGAETLRKDLLRTRSSEPFFQKESTRRHLEEVATFYCKSNGINYQQGMLEVVIPFVLFHSKDFELRKCYAYFNSFMRKIFPRVLIQRIVGDKKELPHVLSAITLCEMLLKYHNPRIHQLFLKNEIMLSMVVTQWLVTLFAKDTRISLVYLIYDYFIRRRNKNIIFYLSIGLIVSQQQNIRAAEERDELHRFVNKQLKKVETQEDLNRLIVIAEEIEKNTPESFEMLTKKIGFSEKSCTSMDDLVLTQQDFSSMMKLDEYLTEMLMPIYPAELEKRRQDFFLLYINVMPFGGEGVRLTVTDLEKDFSKKVPPGAKNYIFVYDQLNENVLIAATTDQETHQAVGQSLDQGIFTQPSMPPKRQLRPPSVYLNLICVNNTSMFANLGRPPSKSKTTKPTEVPKYSILQESASRPKKKQAKGMIFTPETNERLNGLYKKFIRANRDNNSNDWQEQKGDAMLLEPDGTQPRLNVQHLRTNNSVQQPHPNYHDMLNDQRSEYLRKDTIQSPSGYRDSLKLDREDSVRASESSACIEVQVDRIKTRLQRLLFEQIGHTEERVCSRMGDINERAVKLEVRLARFITTISALCNSVDQMRFRTSQNVVLRELNKELQLKIKSLEQERRALKEEKELEAMKETVNRMKQTNSTRQERAATPGRDRVVETEKKLLIKENLELKKQRDNLEKQFVQLKEEQSKLMATCQEMAAYCKELENGSDRNLDSDKEEMYHKVVQHAQELEKKYEVLQFESDRQQNVIRELTEAAEASKVSQQKKNEEINQLKLTLRRSQESFTELEKLKSSIAEQSAEIEALNSDLLETKKKNIALQRQIERKEITEKVRAKELDGLRQQNDKLRSDLAEASRNKRTNEAAETSKNREVSKEEEKKLKREIEQLTNQLRDGKQSLISLQEENRLLRQKADRLESQMEAARRRVGEAEKELKKAKEQAPQQSSTSFAAVINALNQLSEGATPNTKELPQQLARLVVNLHRSILSLSDKLAESELELKKLNMYKNKLDHILHEDDRVEYNDFETSQVDAYFFRQKPKTDANLNEQMKRLAAKLDTELEENIKNKAEMIRLRKSLDQQQTNRKLAREGLLAVVDESLDRRERQGQLTVLLSVLELLEQKERLRRKLLGR